MTTIDITILGNCDVGECGATAYVEAEGLWFCAHHFRDHEVALRIAGFDIIDHRDQLTGDELREKPQGPFETDFKPPVPYHGAHGFGPGGYTATTEPIDPDEFGL